MSVLQFIITNSGRAASAQVGQLGPVKLEKVAIGSAGYTPSPTQTSLQKEIKQFEPEGSSISESGIIHITAQDNSADNYTIREIGIFTSTGILFAIYSQTEDILIKGSGSAALFACDFAITNVPPGSITLGDATFEYPPASENVKGVAQIATQEEVKKGLDDNTIVTPLKLYNALKSSVKIATSEEVISGKDHNHFITPAHLRAVIDSVTGSRNRIINGGMAINQRDPSNSPRKITPTHEYCIDRWTATASGANVTAQRISVSGGYAYKFTGATGNTKITFCQRIEAANCLDLIDTNCQLSFTVYSSSITKLIWAIHTAQAPDNWTTYSKFASGEIKISPDIQRYNISFNTNAKVANGIWLDLVTTPLTEGNTIHFSNIQLEKGLHPTPFEYKPIGLELALCQRYYERVWCYADDYDAGISDILFRQSWTFSVSKRIPTWTYIVRPMNVPFEEKLHIPYSRPNTPLPAQGGYILYQNTKNFVTQIQNYQGIGLESGWEIIADAEL